MAKLRPRGFQSLATDVDKPWEHAHVCADAGYHGHQQGYAQTWAQVYVTTGTRGDFFLHIFSALGRSIISFSCNDVDLIKIFIGFHKIISYTTFPGGPAGGGDGRGWRGMGTRRADMSRGSDK